jgi:hypothetical protein
MVNRKAFRLAHSSRLDCDGMGLAAWVEATFACAKVGYLLAGLRGEDWIATHIRPAADSGLNSDLHPRFALLRSLQVAHAARFVT